GVRGGALLVTVGAEGPHTHVDVRSQHLRQLGDVDPGTAVDLRRVLLGEQIDTHLRLLLLVPRLLAQRADPPAVRMGPTARDECHVWTILAPCRPRRFSPSSSPAARGSG